MKETDPDKPALPRLSFAQSITTSRWRRFAMVAAALLLVFAAGLLLLHRLLPPVYFARVLVVAKPYSTDFGPINRTDFPTFLEEEIRFLRSDEVRDRVIKAVDESNGQLNVSSDQVRTILQKSLQLRVVRGFVEIGVSWDNPRVAAYIANIVARSYSEARMEALNKVIKRAMQELHSEVGKQRERMEKLEAEVAEIQSRDEIEDTDLNKFDAPLAAADSSTDLRPYVEAKSRYLQARRIYKEADERWQMELHQHGSPGSPVIIWERAEAPADPLPPSVGRFKYALAR